MDDLLREFLTETNESLDVVDVELVRFEQEANNAKILDNIFRLVHTIKGTCGFLGLPPRPSWASSATGWQSPARRSRSSCRPSTGSRKSSAIWSAISRSQQATT